MAGDRPGRCGTALCVRVVCPCRSGGGRYTVLARFRESVRSSIFPGVRPCANKLRFLNAVSFTTALLLETACLRTFADH